MSMLTFLLIYFPKFHSCSPQNPTRLSATLPLFRGGKTKKPKYEIVPYLADRPNRGYLEKIVYNKIDMKFLAFPPLIKGRVPVGRVGFLFLQRIKLLKRNNSLEGLDDGVVFHGEHTFSSRVLPDFLFGRGLQDYLLQLFVNC